MMLTGVVFSIQDRWKGMNFNEKSRTHSEQSCFPPQFRAKHGNQKMASEREKDLAKRKNLCRLMN